MTGLLIWAMVVGVVGLVLAKAYWDRQHCLGCIWRRLHLLKLHWGEYHLFRRVDCLPSAPPVDFLVISRYGVFPIIAKYCPGRILGRREDEVWMQRGWEAESQFPNPLEGLVAFAAQFAEAADISMECMHSVVVLTGHGRFLNEPPPAVCQPAGLVPFIRLFGADVLDEDEVGAALRVAEEGKE